MDLTLKLLTAILMYFVLAPILGLLCYRLQWLEKAVVAFMILVLLPMNPEKGGFYFLPLPELRTWLNGYEILFICPMSLSLIISGALRNRSRFFQSLNLAFTLSFATFFISSAISATFSVAPLLSFQQVFRLGQIFLVLQAFSGYLITEKEIKFVTLCLVALLLYLDFQFVLTRWVYKTYTFNEILHKNPTGLFCYSLSLIALTPRTGSENDPIKSYFGMIGLIGLMAAAQTQSRAAALFGVIILAISVVRRINLKQPRKSAVSIIGFLCLLLLTIPFSIKTGTSRFRPENEKASTGSDRTRSRMKQISLEIWREHPILGTGPNTYGPYATGIDLTAQSLIQNYQNKGAINRASDQEGVTENFYYLHLCESGALGVLSAVIILLTPLVISLKSVVFFSSHHLAPLQLSLTIFLFLFMVNLTTERYLMFTPTLILFLLLSTLAISVARVIKKTH